MANMTGSFENENNEGPIVNEPSSAALTNASHSFLDKNRQPSDFGKDFLADFRDITSLKEEGDPLAEVKVIHTVG